MIRDRRPLLFIGLICLLPALSFAQPYYEEVSQAAGVQIVHAIDSPMDPLPMGTGAAWGDYDNDGWVDIYVTSKIEPNRLFRNQGDGTFEDKAAAAGVDDPDGRSGGCAFADYDNDGDPDLFVCNSGDNKLFENNGDGTFTDITTAAGIAGGPRNSQTVTWGDYDNDGYLDFYVANHQTETGDPDGEEDRKDQLFHNNGDGTFTDVSTLLDAQDASDRAGKGFIGGWADYDNDGDLDILLVNDCPFGPEHNKLWRNDGSDGAGGWTFTEVGSEAHMNICINGMGLAIGDYNNDGWMDYYMSNIGATALMRNEGDGTFNYQSADAGVEYDMVGENVAVSWGTEFLDIDNDGWEDIYIGGGYLHGEQEDPNGMFMNNHDGTFTDVSSTGGANDSSRTRTVAVGDYDQDGYLDFYLVNYGEATKLFHNMGGTNDWLRVELEGTTSNLNGIGARLTLYSADGSFQIREVRSGSSLGAGTEIAAYFGLPEATTVDSLVIDWPGGTHQSLNNVTVNQRLKVVESGEAAPDAPTDLTATLNGSQIDLDWSDVSGASSYNIYRGPEAYFDIAGETPITSPTASSYSDADDDASNNVIGDPDNNYFYVVTALGSPESGPSNRVGEFDFALDTGFNFITLPLSSATLTDAEDLGVFIDEQVGGNGATAIYRMDGGSWQLMAFKSDGAWILTISDVLEVGGSYLASLDVAGTWTGVGGLQPDVTTTLDAGFNTVMLKFQKALDEGIVDAGDLGLSIDAGASAGGATSIYRMDNGSWELMAFKLDDAWILAVADALIPGYPYLVNMDESVNW